MSCVLNAVSTSTIDGLAVCMCGVVSLRLDSLLQYTEFQGRFCYPTAHHCDADGCYQVPVNALLESNPDVRMGNGTLSPGLKMCVRAPVCDVKCKFGTECTLPGHS